MPRFLLATLLALCGFSTVRGADGPVIDPLDEMHFRAPKEKGNAVQVPGKFGKAIRFTFDKDCRNTFFTSTIRGKPEWDQAAGFSFWVKGDGSESCGGLEFIYDDDYSLRYDYLFPIKSTAWTKITVPWRDLIPVLPVPRARPLDPAGDNRPSKLTALWVGRWWYWGDFPAHAFALDEFRLEKDIPLDNTDYRPTGAPLGRVLAKLKAGKPITILTMGDSLTDFHHWANRDVSWPRLLQKRLQEKYHVTVTLDNPALGGTQLRQNVVLIPRWAARVHEPDLVTVCFGGNDWEAGMRGPMFTEANHDAIDRIRRATRGKADVLILTTVPSVAHWTTMAELTEACRKAAGDRNAGLADTEKAFLADGQKDKERLYVVDKTHLSRAGHELMARTVLEAIERAEVAPGR
jgi:lysophospholipase L1-like esterase